MLSVSGFQWGEDLGGRFFGCAGPAPRTPTSSHRLHAVCGPQQLALVPSAASIQHIQFPLAGRHLSVSQVTTGDPLHRPLSVSTSSHTLLTPDTNVQLHMSCWPKTFHPQHGGPGWRNGAGCQAGIKKARRPLFPDNASGLFANRPREGGGMSHQERSRFNSLGLSVFPAGAAVTEIIVAARVAAATTWQSWYRQVRGCHPAEQRRRNL